MTTGQLEVLPVETEPGPAVARRRRRRRWWWVVPVIAVAVLVVAFPVRAAVGRTELRSLERRWQVSQQLINDGFSQITRFRMAPGPSFAAVIPAVFQEQADDVQRQVNATRGEWVLDPSLHGLRHRIALALAREVTDLRRDARYWRRPNGSPEPPYLSTQTSDAQSQVERALADELQKRSLAPAEPRRVPAVKAVAAGLARLSQIADQPIGARLVVSTAAGLFRVDVDANRVEPVTPVGPRPLHVLQLVPRAGYVAIRAAGPDGPDRSADELYVMGATLAGPVTDVGPVDALWPGERPDTFWVRRPDNTAVEFDAGFQVVRDPVALPYESQPVGATASGVVVALRAPSGQSFTLEIIDPAHPASRPRVVGSGVPLAVCGNRLVWFQNGEQAVVHLTDVVAGIDRTIEPEAGVWPDGAWACSPDNRLVAGAWFSLTDNPADVPGVVDLLTGTVVLTAGGSPDTQPGTTSTVWTSAGDRVFFIGTPSDGRQDPMTFRPGDPGVEHLRLPGDRIDAMAPLP